MNIINLQLSICNLPNLFRQLLYNIKIFSDINYQNINSITSILDQHILYANQGFYKLTTIFPCITHSNGLYISTATFISNVSLMQNSTINYII